MTVDLGQVADIVEQVVISLGGVLAVIGGGIVALKRWVRKTVSEPLNEQLQPNGGRKETTRSLVEEIAEKTDQLVGQVAALEEGRAANARAVQQALEQAKSALTMARETGERLDRHMDRQERRDG